MALLPAVSSADPSDTAWFVHAGAGDRDVKVIALGLTRDLHLFGSTAASPWSIYGEVVVGQWFVHDRSDEPRGNYAQFGVEPVLRRAFAGGPFVEAGIGLDAITPRYRDGERRFSTKFNFADHVAIGVRFGAVRENEVSLRVEHFSNGGIRSPNPGQNFLELRYARRL